MKDSSVYEYKTVDEKLDLPFDLYTRNILISKLVNSVRNKSKLKILDVGGRGGQFKDFLKEDKYYILDLRESERKEENYIVGDIRDAPLKNSSFDVVISSDLYEHIPREDRLKTVSEMLRLSKNFIVLGAPFYSKEVEDAEIRVYDFFLKNAGEPHPWLKEHIENSLPLKDELEDFLIEKGYEFYILETNNISNWLLLQFFIFYAYNYGIPGEKVSKVYRYYNENFVDLGDFLEPTYRKIYLIGERGTLPILEPESKIDKSVDVSKRQNLLSLVFDCIGEDNIGRRNHIGNLDGIINGLNDQLQLKEKEIVEINTIVQEKDNHIGNLDGIINGLNDQLQLKEKEIVEIGVAVQEKDNHIRNLGYTLLSIQSSVTWQLLSKYQGLIERILPLGTIRRHTYDLGLIGIRVIINEGWRSFWLKFRRRLYQKVPFLKVRINKPLVETNIVNAQNHVPLSLEKELVGKFVFPANNLNTIRILTATYQRKNSDLLLYLREKSMNGSILRKAKVKWGNILDNDYTSFRFKTIKDSEGKTFFFHLKGGSPSAAVYYDPELSFPDLQLFYGEEELGGGINFQAFANLKVKDPYEIWILKNEPTKEKLEEYKKESLSFEYRPKISIITPVWNTDEKWLRAAIESVFSQVYDNWELCIADGCSTKLHVRKILEEYAKKDSRIKVKFLDENNGIAGNSNEALSLATGEFIGFLDHDDELAPFALYEVVKLLNQKSELDFIYSDEDKITTEGKRRDPFFKPDWSPDMFLSYNYICHFTTIRKCLVNKVGGFREEYDGSQDYDLFLRVTKKTQKIAHIPYILYHWREVSESAAYIETAKPYAYESAKKALRDHLESSDHDVKIFDGRYKGSYRVKYKIKEHPNISIIIPTKDKVDVLKRCIESIQTKTRYENYEIIIVNNNSQEERTFEYFEKLKLNLKIKILEYNKPFNFSEINNYAVSKVSNEYVVLLNNDTEVISGEWLEAMLEFCKRRDVGAVGAKLLYPNDTIQHAGIIIALGGVAGHSHKNFHKDDPGYTWRPHLIQNLSAVTAACMMLRKEVFKELGGFDEELSVAFNDVELCLKIREKGYLIVYTPYAELYHHESLSRGYENTQEKQARFLKEVEYIKKKWGHVIDKGDPYYNPNLTLDREDFSIKL